MPTRKPAPPATIPDPAEVAPKATGTADPAPTPAPAPALASEAAAPRVDWGTVGGDTTTQDESIESYPSITWLHGNPQMPPESLQARGGYFLGAEYGIIPPVKGTKDSPAATWEHFTFRTREGTAIEGFLTDRLPCAIIRRRLRWTVQIGDNRNIGFPSWAYDDAKAWGNPRTHAQILMVVAGLSEPVALTVKGWLTPCFDPRESGSIPALIKDRLLAGMNTQIRAVNRGKDSVSLLPLAVRVWLGILPSKDTTKPVHYETVGKGRNVSTVTFPCLLRPERRITDPAELARWYVGSTTYGINQGIYADAGPWAAAWERMPDMDRRPGGNPPPTRGERGDGPPPADARNPAGPAPTDEFTDHDDIPF